jgi:hypothetical protein
MSEPLPGPGVLLFSRDPKNRGELIRELDALRDQFENLRINGVDPSSLPEDIEKNAQVVIIDLAQWSPSDEATISGIRASGFKGPMLILGRKDPGEELPSTRVFEKIVFMAKPYDAKEMLGVVRRMVLAPVIAARKFPRHNTNEKAELQIEGQPAFHLCKVRNMSKGGAYLAFERSLHVRIGDVVVLKIRLGSLNREYLIKARVAWLDRAAGFGIEFVSALGKK